MRLTSAAFAGVLVAFHLRVSWDELQKLLFRSDALLDLDALTIGNADLNGDLLGSAAVRVRSVYESLLVAALDGRNGQGQDITGLASLNVKGYL